MEKTIIFSVFQASKTAWVNELAHRQVTSILENAGLKFEEVQGCYKGQTEKSFAISPWDGTLLVMLRRLAQNHHQETLLKIYENGFCFLEDLVTLEETFAGKWTQVQNYTQTSQGFFVIN